MNTKVTDTAGERSYRDDGITTFDAVESLGPSSFRGRGPFSHRHHRFTRVPRDGTDCMDSSAPTPSHLTHSLTSKWHSSSW